MIHPITALSALSPITFAHPAAASKAGAPGFGTLMGHALSQLSTDQTHAETAVAHAISGQGSVTQAMTAVATSQTALDVATSMRNALVQAEGSMMNLQI